MLDRTTIRELLAPFITTLPDSTVDRVLIYLELLLRWNRKINLTAIERPEECITRHFGESFLASRVTPLNGRLLDVGSGAGFPGLAIKLIAPELDVVLLEPVAKKRAFLKEAARACDTTQVEVAGGRIEEFARAQESPSFDIITMRAVGGLEALINSAAILLKPGGCLCLWVGRQQLRAIRNASPGIRFRDPLAIPLSHDRYILTGTSI
ncbi:MAG TPA: 16S rRNA (guanine(527)-N(7))-methyltransferase RsmG [Terriglobia bacterium]|nr:16S rRNA (guanine(527)-N(7))-methyltransferase RsmG [Terriglobia bacterium]